MPALIGQFVDNVLGGSAEPLVAYFGGSKRLSAKDLASLTAIAKRIQNRRVGQARFKRCRPTMRTSLHVRDHRQLEPPFHGLDRPHGRRLVAIDRGDSDRDAGGAPASPGIAAGTILALADRGDQAAGDAVLGSGRAVAFCPVAVRATAKSPARGIGAYPAAACAACDQCSPRAASAIVSPLLPRERQESEGAGNQVCCRR